MVDRHREKKTIEQNVWVSKHTVPRGGSLYEESRERMFKNPPVIVLRPEPNECFICGRGESELDTPLESHHFGLERCFAETKNLRWDLIARDFPYFDWLNFDPNDPYSFADDMTAQGMPLCRDHHRGKYTGIHYLEFIVWLMQRYLPEGYQFAPGETVEHGDDEVG